MERVSCSSDMERINLVSPPVPQVAVVGVGALPLLSSSVLHHPLVLDINALMVVVIIKVIINNIESMGNLGRSNWADANLRVGVVGAQLQFEEFFCDQMIEMMTTSGNLSPK